MDRADLSRLLGAEPLLAEPRDVVVEEREPARFMDAFTDAVGAGGTVFLADPAWSAGERAQFNALVGRRTLGAGHPRGGRGWLCIPTGGSSGAIRLARHDEDTISAAVTGFCTHFGATKVNAVGLLPLHHVSGLMAWMRTVLTGGTYVPWSWKAVEAGERPVRPADGGDWFLSLVPTQLQRLLGDAEAEEWLRGFRAVFVGGGPAWPELIEAGAWARLPLAFSYGMTETAAMVTALRPEEFLAGERGSGSPLPHARITLVDEGRIAIEAASLFRGYWPESRSEGAWLTEDLGHFDQRGRLHVLGRRDALIITGGEKVDPAEVEAALRATRRFVDVAVIGVPDAEWGEIVVACYPAGAETPDAAGMSALLATLAVYKRPKRYIAVTDWPRNAQGKVNRGELRKRVSHA
jgi:O-succinylbenzoic acid--CoA ligase